MCGRLAERNLAVAAVWTLIRQCSPCGDGLGPQKRCYPWKRLPLGATRAMGVVAPRPSGVGIVGFTEVSRAQLGLRPPCFRPAIPAGAGRRAVSGTRDRASTPALVRLSSRQDVDGHPD